MEANQETVVTMNQEEDELDSKESVLQKYFLQEWNIVKSLLDDIVSNARVSDSSSVHRIRSIVLFFVHDDYLHPFINFCY